MVEIGLVLLGMFLGLLIAVIAFTTGLGMGAAAERERYRKELERVANLAELLIKTRKSQNEQLEELRKAVKSLRDAALALTGRRLH